MFRGCFFAADRCRRCTQLRLFAALLNHAVLLPEASLPGGGSPMPDACPAGRRRCPRQAHRAQSASCGPHRQKVLYLRGAGRPRLHRDHRAHQGGGLLRRRQGHPSCDLRRPMHRKCYPIAADFLPSLVADRASSAKKTACILPPGKPRGSHAAPRTQPAPFCTPRFCRQAWRRPEIKRHHKGMGVTPHPFADVSARWPQSTPPSAPRGRTWT